jgi:hypothetical protein
VGHARAYWYTSHRRTDGADRTSDIRADPIEHDMAPTTPRVLQVTLLAVVLLAGCNGDPGPETDVAHEARPSPGTATTDVTSPTPAEPEASPTTTASPSEATTTPSYSTVPSIPDLSGREIACSDVEDPCDHGDDPQLDRMWDACAEGDGRACDRLYYDSGFDTRYEQFGNTCGDRDRTVPCPDELS